MTARPGRRPITSSRLLLIAAGVVLLATAALTLLPGSPLPYRIIADAVSPYLGPRRMAFVLNIVLFVPIGLILGRFERARWLLVAPALSLTIEGAQFLIPGRSPDGYDLIANSAGAAIGFLLMRSEPSRWVRAGATANDGAPRGGG